MKKINILIAGVGGQGIVLCSDILGDAAIAAGYDVKKTDTLGMAQRGGSVVSHVRIAEKVWSPLIPEGEVDLLLAFEKLEAASWVHYLRRQAKVIVNDYALPPLSVSLGTATYPSDLEIQAVLKQRTDRVFFLEGSRRSRELGDARVIGSFMLGCASGYLPLKTAVLREVIAGKVPEKSRELNLKAFDEGRKVTKS
ncbi:MAG: indolepyruvate oxidoreductase subunit beta [Chloroflexi bacterium]|nr:indolepyruvate oxidoreductase subunit beta [Chloroflexota bacterium]